MAQQVYVGLDLGGKFHEAQVTDVSGGRLGKSFRIPRGRAGLEALLQGVVRVAGTQAEPVFTVEATRNYWQEIVHPLQRDGRTVHLVSPDKSASLRAFYRRHTKNDALDAEATSRLPVVDPRLPVRHRVDVRIETMQRLVRQYWTLRGQMAARKKRLLDRVTMVYPGYESVFRNRYCIASLRFIAGYLDPARARRLGRARLYRLLNLDSRGHFSTTAMDRLWKVVENAPALEIDYADLQFSVRQELELLASEERVRHALRERTVELYSEVDPSCRLASVPGLGDFLAAAITAFIGDVARFHRADELVSLAGLCPKLRSSAGHATPNLPITKRGDPVFRSCLYHAVQVSRQYDPEIQNFYARLRERGKHHNVASCAAAAKLLRRCFALMREARPYRVTGIDEIVRKNGEEGKTIRASVFEVAERLRNETGVVLPLDDGTPASGSTDDSASRAEPTATGALSSAKRPVKRRQTQHGKMSSLAHPDAHTRPPRTTGGA